VSGKTSRQIVIDSLEHKKNSRVPIDFGSQSNTTITLKALDNLKNYLNKSRDINDDKLMAKHFQSAEVPEYFLLRYEVDFRSVKPGKPENREDIIFDDGSFLDEWNIKYKSSGNGLYYDIAEHPLKNFRKNDLDSFNWPDPNDKGRTLGLKEKVENLYYNTKFAIVGNMTSAQIFERCWYLRGFENFLTDLYLNKSFAHKLLDKVTDIQIQRIDNFLKICGKFLNIFKISDDLCGQLAPFISPEIYDEMIMPYHIKYIQHIKKSTNAKVALHCCGNIRPLLERLIEIGIEIIHPFQFSSREMDPASLKEKFGKKLIFWGGIDVQSFLPKANTEEVASEVIKIMSLMSIGGGYIFAPSHNIQVDIPPENIEAMYKAAIKYNNKYY
jgi:uroporphyrinogen decarboxylase